MLCYVEFMSENGAKLLIWIEFALFKNILKWNFTSGDVAYVGET